MLKNQQLESPQGANTKAIHVILIKNAFILFIDNHDFWKTSKSSEYWDFI